MSRAFVKENDLEHAGIDVPERPISSEKNYVTPNGLMELEEKISNLEEERTKIVKNHDNIGNALQELEQKKILSCGSNRYSGVVVLDDEAREYFKCEKRFDREISKMKKKLRNSENNVKMIDY